MAQSIGDEANHMSTYPARCATCGAVWSDGRFTENCAECGGGAMERPCFLCGGRCGLVMLRTVSDSNDSGLGHWAGRCRLPEEEQRRLMSVEPRR
jgi:hypothetical protein